jgi:hypothetical protein
VRRRIRNDATLGDAPEKTNGSAHAIEVNR